jgi:hypothetical protein
MPRFDDIDIFDGPALDAMGVPITGSSRDMHLQMAESIIRDRYVDPLQAKAKDALKMKVSEALESVPGITGSAIAKVVAMADSSDPDDKRIFNQLVSKLNLPFDVRRTGDDYRVSKRFQDVLGDNSNVGVSAYLPDEGDNQYRIEASKRFPDFLGGEASVSANMSTEGGPEIRANFVKRFAEGGSAGDIDIFGYNLGGSVGQMMGRRPEIEVPDLSPAQMANIGAAFADPLGLIDISGEFPEFPAGDVSISGMVMEGPRSPSLAENLREGNYGSAVLQGIGVVPVVGGVMRAARGLGKAADRLERAKKAGFDTDTVYYHGADADITEFRMPSRETGQTKTVGTGVFMSSSPDVASSYAKSIDGAAVYPVYINKKDFLKVRPVGKGNFWSDIPTDGLVVEFPDGSTKPATEVFKLDSGSTDTDELSRIAKSQGRKGLIIEGVVDAGTGGSGEYRYATQYLKEKGYDVSLPIGSTKEAYDKMSAVPSEVMNEARLYAKEQLYRPADVVVSFDPKNIRSVNAEFEDLDSPELLKAEGGAIDINDIDIFEPVQNFVGGGGVGKKLLSGKADDAEKGIGSLPVGDEAARQGIRAFHGSPHDFPPVRELEMPDGAVVYQSMDDAVPEGAQVIAEHPLGRFDMSKLGTGEGAQAYGQGLYFAESEDLARGYRDQLTKPRVQRAQRLLSNSGNDVDLAIENAKKEIDRLRSLDLTPETGSSKRESLISLQEEKIAELTKLKNTGQMSKGSMYEVNIDADPDELIDWDELIDEQPKKVMDKLQSADWWPYAEEGIYDIAGARGENPTGADLVRWLEQDGQDYAAEALEDLGIKGVKYADAFTRHKPKDKRSNNYVIFDPRIIEISKKYGISIPLASAVIAGTVTPEEAQAVGFGSVVKKSLSDKTDEMQQGIGSLPVGDEMVKAVTYSF